MQETCLAKIASPATGFCSEAFFFLCALSERVFVQSFACSSEQVSVTKQPSPLPLPDVHQQQRRSGVQTCRNSIFDQFPDRINGSWKLQEEP